jgi:ribosomal protein S18 acetylase RimI-like enzyme
VIGPADVEAIEQATVAALSPDEAIEIGGWLVALGSGAPRRSRSAVPLRHDVPADPEILSAIEAEYARRDLPPAFRIADAPGLEPVRQALSDRGYRFEQPTLVMVGETAGLRAVASGGTCELQASPDESWTSVYLGPGFDPVDGTSRIELLTRSADNRFGAVRDQRVALAVGVVSFGNGWASVHGMRTAAERRGQGLAGRVLAGLAQAAEDRGLSRVFLQVEEPNAPARALYWRAGFERAWRYFYWQRPA